MSSKKMKNKKTPIIITAAVLLVAAAAVWLLFFRTASGDAVYVMPVSAVSVFSTGSANRYGGMVEPQQTVEFRKDSSKTVSITVPTNNSQLTNGAGYQTAANVSAAIPIKSIKVNGSALTPDSGKAVSITVPTSNSQLSNGAGYQTASDVSAAIASALSGVTSISYQTVTTLPATGAAGVIYLVAHSHGDRDSYDEYLWLGSAYEKIGNTDINLSGYVKTTDLGAISNAQIDTICAT